MPDDTPRPDRADDEDDEDRPRKRRRPRDDDEEEEEDDRPRRRRRRSDEAGDDGLQYVIPVNTSGLAIAAGYVGLISVLCLPAPIALILGILAVRQLKKNPKMHGMGRAIFAIVMGAIFSIVFVGMLILGAANGFK